MERAGRGEGYCRVRGTQRHSSGVESRLSLCEDSCQCGLVYCKGGHWTEGGVHARSPQCACSRTVQVMRMFSAHTAERVEERTGRDGSLRGAATLSPSRSGSNR